MSNEAKPQRDGARTRIRWELEQIAYQGSNASTARHHPHAGVPKWAVTGGDVGYAVDGSGLTANDWHDVFTEPVLYAAAPAAGTRY